ncbi:SIS domain-containing protein [Streptomyces sp. 110]|uniref:SIS domain-containing protein n=1 Tax=Streptomyces endocoffeicus TaxID=2898945 RepID=A0ABS1Q4T1_9ACTN|nr:SIS domain-containing protein [Streptomyces endocoffeicus]
MNPSDRPLGEGGRRWFCSGLGRSSLVAQMSAMRLMHTGYEAHALGEATATAIGAGDGLVMIPGSGETPVTVHLARLARDSGARILAVTSRRRQHPRWPVGRGDRIPAAGSGQFGGTLFEQSALLLGLTATTSGRDRYKEWLAATSTPVVPVCSAIVRRAGGEIMRSSQPFDGVSECWVAGNRRYPGAGGVIGSSGCPCEHHWIR